MNKILWETPEESINGASFFTLSEKGLERILTIKFGKKKIEIHFHRTMGYKYNHHRYSHDFVKIHECYEVLIEVVDSDWIKEIYECHGKIIPCWETKHYAISNENDGVYQFIAESFEIIEYSE